VTWGLAGAIVAALLYGVTTVLQAVAVRRQPAAVGLDVRLLRGLAHSPLFGLAMLGEFIGFLLSLAALRSLPLFVVQAVLCGNFAVTAVLGHFVLGMRLSRLERVAVVVVTAGITLLVLSARAGSATPLSSEGRLALVGAAGALAAVAFGVARWRSPRRAPALGLLAGLAFGTADISARVLHDPSSPAAMLSDPATLSLAAAGLLGLWLNATALQLARVATVVAADVVAYTVVPALVGVLALGDRTRSGWVPVAVLGFLLAVAGALALATYDVSPSEPAREPSPRSRRAPSPDRSVR
jgi:drug/metabolite transporter (DMT)-like permease